MARLEGNKKMTKLLPVSTQTKEVPQATMMDLMVKAQAMDRNSLMKKYQKF